jgi:hypothetical protein
MRGLWKDHKIYRGKKKFWEELIAYFHLSTISIFDARRKEI